MKSIYLLPILAITLSVSSISHAECPSEAKLTIESAGYSGPIEIELRKGNRPGSRVIGQDQVYTRGTVVFRNVCPGTYFYSFATPDSDQVSTTSYFKIIDDGYQYSMPSVTVTYTRATSSGSRVGSAKKRDL